MSLKTAAWLAGMTLITILKTGVRTQGKPATRICLDESGNLSLKLVMNLIVDCYLVVVVVFGIRSVGIIAYCGGGCIFQWAVWFGCLCDICGLVWLVKRLKKRYEQNKRRNRTSCARMKLTCQQFNRNSKCIIS